MDDELTWSEVVLWGEEYSGGGGNRKRNMGEVGCRPQELAGLQRAGCKRAVSGPYVKALLNSCR